MSYFGPLANKTACTNLVRFSKRCISVRPEVCSSTGGTSGEPTLAQLNDGADEEDVWTPVDQHPPPQFRLRIGLEVGL
jgi:hypothetical protein